MDGKREERTEDKPANDEGGGPQPFAGGGGRGVRIAVIDSGVFPSHPHIRGVSGGVWIGDNHQLDSTDYLDRLGHGTAVMAAIQEKAPDAEYFAVKVFDAALRTTGNAIVRAIAWCLDHQMDVVNLSLGTTNANHADALSQVAVRAAAEGVLLVAALKAGAEMCYPGCLPGVFGVDLDWDCPRERYRYGVLEGRTIFAASGYPRPVPGVAPARNLSGISFAVANMSGFVAQACTFTGKERGDKSRFAAIQDALVAAAGPV